MIGHSPAGHEPAILFLRAFRRRSLLAAALRLCFFAALANEAVRWLAVGSNFLFDTSLTVVSVGPAVFALTMAVTLIRWSTAAAARRADRALALKDRLVSYLDFSRRSEVPEAVVRAQKAETEAALAAESPKRAVPVRFVHFGAPLLLVLSLLWPSFLSGSPGAPPAIFHPGLRVSQRPDGAPAPPPEGSHPPPHGLSGRTGEEPGGREEPGEVTVREKIGPPLAALDSAHEEPQAAGNNRAPKSDVEREGPVNSNPVGDRLSSVVDPLYAPGAEGDTPAPDLPGGSMTFPLLPETAGSGGGPGSPTAAGSGAAGVVVDFDSLPEKYRIIVERYFLLLAGEGS